MKYKVLIPTSGTGSRLGELTKGTNKALVPVQGKPALEHIINKYPDSVPLVITLGYLADQVRSWVDATFPDRNIEYVTVDKYEGTGASLGYSMLQAKKQLQFPFIFHACDTLLTENIPVPEYNWTGGYVMPQEISDIARQHYRTQTCNDAGELVRINEIGSPDFDYIHIGITGVYDYEAWWGALEGVYGSDPNDSSVSDTHVITAMLDRGYAFKVVPCNEWYDIGNPEALSRTKVVFDRG